MLLSMTGFGEAHRKSTELSAAAEVRTINSRYFKLVIRAGEGYANLEQPIESLVRDHIKRGTVQVTLRLDRARVLDDYRVNVDVLAGYRQQLNALLREWQADEDTSIEGLLGLPGVVNQNPTQPIDMETEWPVIRDTLLEAIERMTTMRAQEGQAMAADLSANANLIRRELAAIEKRAPSVAEGYRTRLTERVSKTLADYEITLNPGDLVREVSIYTERSDISEETVRLNSHLDQFATTLALPESSGRKLEFLTQEMFRETNTIGSKANDVEISRHVIEIKTAIERIREMIQNVE